MRISRVLVGLLLAVGLVSGQTPVRTLAVVDLLDSYGAGRFDAVVEQLASTTDFDPVLEQLRRDGPSWIAAGAPDARERRQLAAATFALEAARAGEWLDWKAIQRQPKMCAGGGGECYQPPSVLYWRAPPLLIEWACESFRSQTTPRPIERWWQLAALAVAQRSEDPQFLIGDTHLGRGLGSEEIGNTADEIKHLDHATARFPNERRLLLAQGIARDRDVPEDATVAYRALRDDPDVGGEAAMRLGAMQLRRGQLPDALRNLERAETLTRDPYVVFLARYFRGQLQERRRDFKAAESAYRGAAAAVPQAQSATMALATLAFRDGRRTEAVKLVAAMFAANPRPRDPWPAFVHADDRFWPQLVGRLRSEIAK